MPIQGEDEAIPRFLVKKATELRLILGTTLREML
jgi:hypothetical protein